MPTFIPRSSSRSTRGPAESGPAALNEKIPSSRPRFSPHNPNIQPSSAAFQHPATAIIFRQAPSVVTSPRANRGPIPRTRTVVRNRPGTSTLQQRPTPPKPSFFSHEGARKMVGLVAEQWHSFFLWVGTLPFLLMIRAKLLPSAQESQGVMLFTSLEERDKWVGERKERMQQERRRATLGAALVGLMVGVLCWTMLMMFEEEYVWDAFDEYYEHFDDHL